MDLNSRPTREKMDKKTSRAKLDDLQSSMLRLQQTVYKHGHRIVFVFEGADAAGKGGAIRRLTAKLDPRGLRVHPIGPPSEDELARHYLQRFFKRFPRHGELVIFDRSWYGRVLVERVDNLASEREWRRAYREINELEQWLIDDGTIVLKFFMHISREAQKERLIERLNNHDKRWKIGMPDLEAHEKWDAYTEAFQDMLAQTNTDVCPWQIVAADNKHSARVAVLERTVDILGQQLPQYGDQLSPDIEARAAELFAGDYP